MIAKIDKPINPIIIIIENNSLKEAGRHLKKWQKR